MPGDPFSVWFEALQKRHQKYLTFSEIRRAVQALSSQYVERRGSLDRKSPLDGAGKRAAFAMYFAPLHFLLVRNVVRALGASIRRDATILDLGCGTGIAGAAWALETYPDAKVVGVDRNSWVLEECRWTYRQLGIHGITKAHDIDAFHLPPNVAVIAAFTVNELDVTTRRRLSSEFLADNPKIGPILVIEPIARRIVSWWDEWAHDFKAAGGREDEWRFRMDLPEELGRMDKAAGLNHRELTGRSLWLPGPA